MVFRLLFLNLFISLNLWAQTTNCPQISGKYEIKNTSCEPSLDSELAYPVDGGIISIGKPGTLTLEQKGCSEIKISMNNQSNILTLAKVDNRSVFFSNYGHIIREKNPKYHDCPSYFKNGKCAKFTNKIQWNIDMNGSGGLTLKMFKEVKRFKIFPVIKEISLNCEFEKVD